MLSYCYSLRHGGLPAGTPAAKAQTIVYLSGRAVINCPTSQGYTPQQITHPRTARVALSPIISQPTHRAKGDIIASIATLTFCQHCHQWNSFYPGTATAQANNTGAGKGN